MSKATLIETKKMLQLSTNGYELLDKKAYILSTEILDLKQKRKKIKESIEDVLIEVKEYFVSASMDMGLSGIALFARRVEIDNSLSILKTSIMGVEVSRINKKTDPKIDLPAGIDNYKSLIKTIEKMQDIKDLIILLAMIEESIKKLSKSLKKTQVRVNALKNVVIPRQIRIIAQLSDKIDEQDRETYGRLIKIQ